MAEFATLETGTPNIPLTGSSTGDNALGLMNPDSILSGTLRGTQFVGSAALQIDSTQGLITINDTSLSNVLSIGKISPTMFGMSVKDTATGVNTLFFGQGTDSSLGLTLSSSSGTALSLAQFADNSVGLNVPDASGNAVLFAGKDSTGATVVKVAKPGFDARTASAANLIFNSTQNIFKIVKIGTLNIDIPGTLASNTTSSISVAHGLNYIPAFMGFIISQTYLGNAYIQTPYTVTFNIVSGVPQPLTFYLSVDATDIYANIYNGGGVGVSAVGTTIFKYYILQETAT